jgi:hypothetical protein
VRPVASCGRPEPPVRWMSSLGAPLMVLLGLCAALGGSCLAAGSAVRAAGAVAPSPARGAPTSLRSAVSTADGTWVVLPIGELGDPSNTFWQLLYAAPGSTRWSVVTPKGTADNGGLVAGASAL